MSEVKMRRGCEEVVGKIEEEEVSDLAETLGEFLVSASQDHKFQLGQ